MISEATIVSRFEALIERANKLIQEKHRSTYDRIDLVDSAQYQGWRAQALTALVDLVSEAHPYTKAFESAARDTEVSYVESAKQVLVSLLDDLKRDTCRVCRT